MKRVAAFAATAALTFGVLTAPADAAAALDGYLAVGDAASGQLYTFNSLGTNRTQITHNRAGEFASGPKWSPDGRRIVFTKALQNGHDRMFSVAADGSDLRQVRGDGFAWNNESPSYLPDGDTLIFSRCHLIDPGGSCTIESVGTDGTGLHDLTPTQFEVYDFFPVASPDGSHIAFTRYNYRGSLGRTWVMNADGTDPHPITSPALEALLPSWDADGASVVVASNCCRNGGNLYRVPIDGDAVTRLTSTPYPNYSGSPSVAPSGRQIAFASDRRHPDKSAADLFLMSADGSHQVLVNTGLSGITSLDWGPAPN